MFFYYYIMKYVNIKMFFYVHVCACEFIDGIKTSELGEIDEG